MAENTVTAKRLHHLANDLTGRVFGLLTVIGTAPQRYHGYLAWACRCACGQTVALGSLRLISQGVTDCGCSRRIKTARMKLPEYGIWNGIRKRCSSAKSWKRYAGRGITVCERWQDFENFYSDMGPRPSPQHSIDRYPNNEGNYEPHNCRWATKQEQARNFSRTPQQKRRHADIASFIPVTS